jgi:hypothetical protein
MVLKAQIGGYDIGRVFMDAGSGINLIYARTLRAMCISLDSLNLIYARTLRAMYQGAQITLSGK